MGPCEEQVEPPAWDHLRGFKTLVSHAPPPRLLPRTVTSVTGLRPCALPTPHSGLRLQRAGVPSVLLGTLPFSGTAEWVHLILGCRGEGACLASRRGATFSERPRWRESSFLIPISLTLAPALRLAPLAFSGSFWKTWFIGGRE